MIESGVDRSNTLKGRRTGTNAALQGRIYSRSFVDKTHERMVAFRRATAVSGVMKAFHPHVISDDRQT